MRPAHVRSNLRALGLCALVVGGVLWSTAWYVRGVAEAAEHASKPCYLGHDGLELPADEAPPRLTAEAPSESSRLGG